MCFSSRMRSSAVVERSDFLYRGGAVPATYKTLYYELIQSVDKGQWPSQQWVTDGNRFFDLTKAPEELPPLTITQSR